MISADFRAAILLKTHMWDMSHLRIRFVLCCMRVCNNMDTTHSPSNSAMQVNIISMCVYLYDHYGSTLMFVDVCRYIDRKDS